MSQTEEDIQPPNPTAEEETYYPARFWWLKRLGCAAILLIVTVVGLRIWAGISTDKRLSAMVEAYRAAGDPILLEDFATPTVLDEENAALTLEKAARELVWPAEIAARPSELGRPSYIIRHWNEIEKLVQANAVTLNLLRVVRSKPALDWRTRITRPAIMFLPTGYLNWHELGSIAAAAIAHEHQRGNHAEAAEINIDALLFAELVDQQSPSMLSHSILWTIISNTTHAIAMMRPSLRINILAVPANAPESQNGIIPVSELRVRQWMSVLLDEDSQRETFLRSFYFERAAYYDAMSTFDSNKPMMLFGASVVRADTIELLECATKYIEAARSGDYSSAMEIFPHNTELRTELYELEHPVTVLAARYTGRFFVMEFLSRAERRMAAIALAISLYESHHSRRPIDLTELIPDYIAEIPADPFAADGRPIAYAPEAPRPLLYSVSMNGRDDDGRYEMRESNRINLNVADYPFFLDGIGQEEIIDHE